MITLLDASGEALRQGVAGRPDILKINRHELAMLDPCASDLSDMETAVDHLLPRLGVWASDAIVVTVGIRGAVAVTAEGVYTARALDVPAVNTAGAGDAMSGALMLARSRGQTWSQALALGTAAAGAVVMTEGTGICRRVQVEALLPRVRVTALSTRGIASD